MSTLALALVLSSAVAHASWNLLAKRVGSGAPVVFLYTVVSSLVFALPALYLVVAQGHRIGWLELGFIAGTAALHVAYFLTLQRGYEIGDLSIVYPLARGTAPLLASIGAFFILGERPGPLAVAGIALITLGALSLMGRVDVAGERFPRGVAHGLLTGGLIATYTLWDKHAVGALNIAPLLYDWGNNLGRVLILLPLVRHRTDEMKRVWRTRRREVLGIGMLSSLAYILVLTALAQAPVSYVAPVREISIVIGTFFGTHLLAEGHGVRRLIGATTIVAGVVFLAAG